MRAIKTLVTALFLSMAASVAVLPGTVAMAQETQVSETASSFDVLYGGTQFASDTTVAALRQIIKVVPYVGVVLFVVGIFVAIFSTRNKGHRRWGLKMAISEAIIMYVLYIALILTHDYVCLDKTVQFSSQPAQMDFYEKTYYDAMAGIIADGQSFLFLSNDWVNGVAVAGRGMYVSIVGLLVFASISIGALLVLITKRERAIRRFALAGLCIVSPITLEIGYLFFRL